MNTFCWIVQHTYCNVLPYILQNDLTGEHSCIMLHLLSDEDTEDGQDKKEDSWLYAFWKGMYMLPFVGNQGNISGICFDLNFVKYLNSIFFIFWLQILEGVLCHY